MKSAQILSSVAILSLLAACAQPGSSRGITQGGGGLNKQDIGTVAGGIAGGVAGYQFGGGSGKAVATVAGTLLGAWLGNELGQSLDNADRAAMGNTTQNALENAQTGQALPWSNPNSGRSGTVVAGNYYQQGGQYCREFTQRINVGDRYEEAYGTACRQPDGSWKIVK